MEWGTCKRGNLYAIQFNFLSTSNFGDLHIFNYSFGACKSCINTVLNIFSIKINCKIIEFLRAFRTNQVQFRSWCMRCPSSELRLLRNLYYDPHGYGKIRYYLFQMVVRPLLQAHSYIRHHNPQGTSYTWYSKSRMDGHVFVL